MVMHHPSSTARALWRSASLCLFCTGIAGVSHAQSSVTLFGGIDLGVRSVHNAVGTINAMNSGGNYTSRWGLRGEEDLGSGLKASFWLESTIFADTGSVTASQMFDRRSTLSLSSKSVGEVRLGRDYTPAFRGYGIAEVFDFSGTASMTTLYSGSASTVLSRAFQGKTSSNGRTNNSVGYFTPNTLGGFYLNAMVSKDDGGNVSGNYDYRGLRIGYDKGPLHVNAFAGSTSIKQSSSNYLIRGVAGAYKFSHFKLTAAAVNMRFLDARQSNYTVGLLLPVGAHQIKATWHHIDQKGRAANGAPIDGNDADMLAIGYVHNLSKRTALYSTVTLLHNHGQAKFDISGAAPGAPAGSKSRGVELGLRHTF